MLFELQRETILWRVQEPGQVLGSQWERKLPESCLQQRIQQGVVEAIVEERRDNAAKP